MAFFSLEEGASSGGEKFADGTLLCGGFSCKSVTVEEEDDSCSKGFCIAFPPSRLVTDGKAGEAATVGGVEAFPADNL